MQVSFEFPAVQQRSFSAPLNLSSRLVALVLLVRERSPDSHSSRYRIASAPAFGRRNKDVIIATVFLSSSTKARGPPTGIRLFCFFPFRVGRWGTIKSTKTIDERARRVDKLHGEESARCVGVRASADRKRKKRSRREMEEPRVRLSY